MAVAEADSLLKRPLYVYDLPPDLLSSLEPKSVDAAISAQTDPPAPSEVDSVKKTSSNEPPASESPRDNSPSKATSCALCSLSFASVQDQRSHVRSDLHSYNLRQKLRGQAAISEAEFEKMVEDLDESLSGSDDTDSESGSDFEEERRSDGTMLSNLLKKQANISEPLSENFTAGKKRKRGAGKPPMVWFATPRLPSNTSLGIWRAIFTNTEQEDGDNGRILNHLRNKQLRPQVKAAGADQGLDDGGVALPKPAEGPHIFMCMIGGGHFAAMVVSLTPKSNRQGSAGDRQASVLAHKTFHRYTTRRKQGGGQAANDAAKGSAHSAGSSLRRYNEDALIKDVRTLLADWKRLINTSELVFVRATGSSNRRTLFGPYENQVLRQDDPRNRSFPFSTRRATQAELMRSFVELTRVKVEVVDEAALAAIAEAAAREEREKQQSKIKSEKAKSTKPAVSKEQEEALLHTSQIEALVKRAKIPALLAYLSTNAISPDFEFAPEDTQAHHHTPRPLHLAAASGSPALVTALLVKGGADPTLINGEGRTAFELAGDRATRDAFRLARKELGESRWSWEDAKVLEALSKAEIDERAALEKAEEMKAEAERRKEGINKLQEEEKRKQNEKQREADEQREKKMGKGHLLNAGRERTAQERREEQARGMTPEMRLKMEREQRARAMEARLRR